VEKNFRGLKKILAPKSSNAGQAENNPRQGRERKTGENISKIFPRVERRAAKFSLASFASRIQKKHPAQKAVVVEEKTSPESYFREH
jgi:hypothetical protein